jgi:hypothetical protein
MKYTYILLLMIITGGVSKGQIPGWQQRYMDSVNRIEKLEESGMELVRVYVRPKSIRTARQYERWSRRNNRHEHKKWIQYLKKEQKKKPTSSTNKE